MRLRLRQHFTQISASAAAAAYADPLLYAHLRQLAFGGNPNVLEHRIENDTTTMAIRYRIDADVPSAARMFVDPDKLTFIEYSTVTADGGGSFDIVPDYYSDMLAAFGTIAVDDGARTRSLTGELNIDLGIAGMLFQDQAERQIGQGIAQVLEAQVEAVEAFVLAAASS